MQNNETGINCHSLINTGPENPSTLIDTNTLLGDHFVVRGKGKLHCMSSRGGQTNEAGTTISRRLPAIKTLTTAENHEYSTNFSNQAANMVSCTARQRTNKKKEPQKRKQLLQGLLASETTCHNFAIVRVKSPFEMCINAEPVSRESTGPSSQEHAGRKMKLRTQDKRWADISRVQYIDSGYTVIRQQTLGVGTKRRKRGKRNRFSN